MFTNFVSLGSLEVSQDSMVSLFSHIEASLRNTAESFSFLRFGNFSFPEACGAFLLKNIVASSSFSTLENTICSYFRLSAVWHLSLLVYFYDI